MGPPVSPPVSPVSPPLPVSPSPESPSPPSSPGSPEEESESPASPASPSLPGSPLSESSPSEAPESSSASSKGLSRTVGVTGASGARRKRPLPPPAKEPRLSSLVALLQFFQLRIGHLGLRFRSARSGALDWARTSWPRWRTAHRRATPSLRAAEAGVTDSGSFRSARFRTLLRGIPLGRRCFCRLAVRD